ncbi:MAG: TfoX/Sxy family protein [Hyphomicrobiaceae bacterium]
MARDLELEALLAEQLAPLGPVAFRRMFGSVGLFLDGLMFGIISDGVLFLKTDAETRAAFEAEGLRAFTYQRKGSDATITSLWKAPDRLLDDADELCDWASVAFAVARRAKAKSVTPGSARVRSRARVPTARRPKGGA